MPSNSAEYMRSYRARRKEERDRIVNHVGGTTEIGTAYLTRVERENATLTEEVARLKRLLAERPHRGAAFDEATEVPRERYAAVATEDRPFAEFRPVPKPGKRK